MRWIVGVVLAVVVLAGVLWLLQRRLIYFPSQAVPPSVPELPGLETVSYLTDDGLTLTAWFVPRPRETSGATIVLFNGNAGNRAHRLPLAVALSEHGHAVLMVDYRGYGGNPGMPSEPGLGADARAALAYVTDRPDVDAARVVFFGESLGAGVALGLAGTHPPAALILRSPFTSLPDVAAVHYPFVPPGFLRDRYPNIDIIGDIEAPLLVVAGSDDRIVPIGQSRAVFEAAPGPKRFVEIPGAGHNDRALLDGDRMIEAVASFLDESLPAG